MNRITLTQEQKSILDGKIKTLNILHKKAVEKNIKATRHEWTLLDRDLDMAIVQYNYMIEEDGFFNKTIVKLEPKELTSEGFPFSGDVYHCFL